ncbi:MAG TPA: inositol monophosphatase [Candidatus Paceibacterota bacterium]|nr:inositol monophosphatase [Candidatus Paceibacterota bacterium]
MPSQDTAPISLAQLREIAIHAGGIMKTYFSHFGMERITKTDTTPLTLADTQINRMVIDRIREASNEVDIVGEEESDRRNSPWQVMCDPVDGTFPYTWGMPVSTFMIGLMYERKPVMGVIYDPFTERMYYAERGKGAWMNELPLKVSSARERSDRPIVGYVSWPTCPYNVLKVCQYLEERGVTLVNFCSIGYIEAAVATGEFAGTIFPGTSHHDTAPGHIIVSEAGGRVTDIFGGELHYTDNKVAGHLMSNGHIHDLLVEAVKACN